MRIRRLAALYDIHGNLPALERVLADVERADVDAVVIGGDVVPGPMPTATLARLHAWRPVFFIHGNGECDVLAARRGEEIARVPPAFRDVVRWTAQQLDDDTAARLARWPLTLRLTIDHVGEVLFCHATPRSDNELFTADTPEEQLGGILADVHAHAVVCGHTHMQFERIVGQTRVVNAGSVGMPFGEAGAYWLLIDGQFQLRRTAYDLHAAAALIRASGYPRAEEFATGNVLQPPSADAMREAFNKARGGGLGR
jgi:predicted phosphodiesterase